MYYIVIWNILSKYREVKKININKSECIIPSCVFVLIHLCSSGRAT